MSSCYIVMFNFNHIQRGEDDVADLAVDSGHDDDLSAHHCKTEVCNSPWSHRLVS